MKPQAKGSLAEIFVKVFTATCFLLLVTLFYFGISDPNQPEQKRKCQHDQSLLEPNLPSVVFWTSDLHQGSRLDSPSVLQHLGQKVIVNGHKGKQSPHGAIQERFTIPEQRSGVINNYIYHTQTLSETDLIENFNYYKKDPLMALTDAFICIFPASYCELWMPFNRSIIFLPVHRFFLSRCHTPGRMKRLIEHVLALNASLSPKHFIAAGSVYDAEYINYYTGLDPIILSSSSFFYAGHNATTYSMKRKEILLGPLNRQDIPTSDEAELKQASEKKGVKEKWQFGLPVNLYNKHYELQNIADHRAAVLFPYAVMSYGITELYTMAISLLVPSMDMLIKKGWIFDRCMVGDISYCDPKTVMPPKHPDSRHKFNPESHDEADARYWLQFADFYQWPHITFFDSFEDLINKLETMNFTDIHYKMIKANEQREAVLLERWRKIILQIDENRAVPTSYQEALKSLWNTDRLMED